eukprot:TRINITY_DN68039_c0_g1_i1.p1 TRINITY_DN68039_c0_g1~~TRINITY_DN68039_c0_g1_i1.p1  ORF type:complete len:229 (-),score=19.88 TRINITY_DN68039_c0_g1_i1:92-748(-)
MASFTRQQLLRGAMGCCGAAAVYRTAYVVLAGHHQPAPVRVEFSLSSLSPEQAFEVIRNPRLLDETTPPWFRLVIRRCSEQAVDAFLEKSTLLAEGKADSADEVLVLPIYLKYWMLAFFLPFPWTSKVTHCGRCEGPPFPCYQLTYEQHVGPFFGGFRHSHFVKAGEVGKHGATVEDVIDFDVTSEPIINSLTWYVLDWILRGRCKVLNQRYGGNILC